MNKHHIKKAIATVMMVLCLCTLTASSHAQSLPNPKYVFMFIGDGMGSPQISTAQYYLGTLQHPDSAMPIPAPLSFTAFQNVGIMTTYDATSFCPDSASTASAMASGIKTLSGVLNYDTALEQTYPLLTEYAKQAGKKVGVITSVSLDHATPAAYYAKATSRSLYYDIAVQGVTGNTLDFLGGGRFLQPTGKAGDQPDIYELAKANGFTVADTNEAIRALNGESGRVLALAEDPDGAMAMQYEIDRVRMAAEGLDSMSLATYVDVGINVLDNEGGFFMMVEGGKIDWSCHANDGLTTIYETLAFSDAVQVAVDFAKDHPDETLIIVTGDHETGGLTIGFAVTAYDTHFSYLQAQNISYDRFGAVVTGLRDAGAPFEEALTAIQAHYGLTTEAEQPLSLTDTELASLEKAFALSMRKEEDRQIGEAEKLAYGGYDPLTMAVSHILNNKAGIAYTSYAHTGLQLPVYAMGAGAERFSGSYDNTDIFQKTMAALGLAQ